MMMKALIYLSLILLPLLAVVEGGLNVGGRTHLGGQTPIDVSDKNVIEIAKYAISEHNKESKENLVLEKVVQGTTQVVSGTKYDLIIAAKNGSGATKKYEAIVVEKLWLQSKTLESFKAV